MQFSVKKFEKKKVIYRKVIFKIDNYNINILIKQYFKKIVFKDMKMLQKNYVKRDHL